MARRCALSGKTFLRGHNVSHANNKTPKTSLPNLHMRRLYDSESGKWVRLKVSSRVLRTIDRKGLAAAVRDILR